MPHTLRAANRNGEAFSALKILSGFDDDIARERTRTANRLRGILTQIFPSLESALAGSTLPQTQCWTYTNPLQGATGLKREGRARALN